VREHVLAVFQRHLPGKLKPSGGSNYLTTCPFHKEGMERTPSFSVNVEKGAYHCFTCHRAGGVKRLLRELGVARSVIDVDTRSIEPYLQRNEQNTKLQKRHAFLDKDPFLAKWILPEALLAVYDHAPVSLIQDGFDREVLNDLEVGFDFRNARITYPLRDLYGNLAGISGGTVLQGALPKYKVYQGGRVDQGRKTVGDFGQTFDEEFPGYTCENHDYLWNYDRVYPRIVGSSDPSASVNVVEGFKACSWMLQAGFWNTVALMGSYISDNQQRLLHRLGCSIVLFLDNDEAGRNGTLRIGDLLYKPMHGRVKVIPYPHDDVIASISDQGNKTQPDDYEIEAVQLFEKSAVPFTQHFNYMRRLIQW
jgi:DNA primase